MKYISILVFSLFLFGCASNTATEEKVAQKNVTTNNNNKVKPNQPVKQNTTATKTQANAQNKANSSLTAQQQKIQQQRQQRLKQQQQIAKAKATATASTAGGGAEVSWVKIDKVEGLVKKKPKKVIVDVYTSWCGPCKMLDRTTFKDAEVVKMMSDNFYSVKFNAEGPDPVKFNGKTYTNSKYNPAKKSGRNGQHSLTPTFGIRGYPSIIILDENMKIIDKASGYLKPAQMKAFLSKHV